MSADWPVFLIKLAVAITVVLAISLVAERVSSRAAGILSGYPAGIAINLFFFGLEVGPSFAAEGAVYTLFGLLATQAFVYFYYLASSRIDRLSILWSSLFSVAGYLAVVLVLRQIPIAPLPAALSAILSVFVFLYLFRQIGNHDIVQRVRLTPFVLVARAVCAAAIILLVTGTARLVGPEYAGLFAAFPSTLFPLMLIIHGTYDVKHVHTIIKNFPLGLGSLVVYALSVRFSYEPLGIYLGTAVSFAAATAYLAGYAVLERMLKARKVES